jgi:hypothetical protein
MAPAGQQDMQRGEPLQDWQRAGSRTIARRRRVMAPSGQIAAQKPQCVH